VERLTSDIIYGQTQTREPLFLFSRSELSRDFKVLKRKKVPEIETTFTCNIKDYQAPSTGKCNP
jgi:hypothetical protein